MSEQFRARAIGALEEVLSAYTLSSAHNARRAFAAIRKCIEAVRALPCEPKAVRESPEATKLIEGALALNKPAPAAQGETMLSEKDARDYMRGYCFERDERIAALEKRQAETEAIVARNQRAFEDFLRQLPTAIASQIDIGLKFGPNKIAGEGGE